MEILANTARLASALLCLGILSSLIITQPGMRPALAEELTLQLNFAPSIIEAGVGTYPIGYVRLVSNGTGQPVIATSDLEVGLSSADASIAFVPSRVTILKGSDYAKFDVEVSDLPGQTEISAYYGNKVVSKTFKVVDAVSIIDDIDLVINLASDKMQIDTEMPFSVYLENNGNILQAQQDIVVEFDYESSLVNLDSKSIVIKKGTYYASNTVRTLEKSGNAFIKATASAGQNGQVLSAVTNVAISQTQPASLKVYAFPDEVGLNENTIDIFVGVLDAAGQPTLASEDIELELFSSAHEVTGIEGAHQIIEKGQFGFHARANMNFYQGQTVTIGASASGLGAGTTSFEVLEASLSAGDQKVIDKAIDVFTVGSMPSAADAIMVYQVSAIEHDADDLDCDQNGEIDSEDLENTDCNEDGLFDTHRDHNRDGLLTLADHHPIDDLDEGEHYPVEATSIYGTGQGNLNVVSSNNLLATISDPGYIASGASYGTAKISSGSRIDAVDFSVSLTNVAVGSNSLSTVGGLNPTQTNIFSPAGLASDGNYRVIFDRDGYTDLYFVTLDSVGRPSNSELGVKYLVKPINELTEITPETSFTNLRVKIDSFKSGDVIVQNAVEALSAVPVGVNADSSLAKTSNVNLLYYTGTSTDVLLPFDNIVAFSKVHPVGIIQLRDASGNPVLASDDTVVELSSTSSNVLPASTVIIPSGKSFVPFEVATFGRADNYTLFATSDGLQASSSIMTPVLAELPASFVGTASLISSVPTTVTVSTPIDGASVTWGSSSGLRLLSNTTGSTSTINSHFTSIKVVSDNVGTYTVDATFTKDGFKPTRISQEVIVGQYQKQMSAALVHTGPAKLAYNQPTVLQVSVRDSGGIPVPGVTVKIEDSGPRGIIPVATLITDASGGASFVYAPSNVGDSSTNFVTLMVTASKDGYQSSRDSKVFEIDGSSLYLPPLPGISTLLTGLPSWTSYAILGGTIALGGGIYMLRQKNPEDDEALVDETGQTKGIEAPDQPELPDETIEEAVEDEVEEEEET